MRRVLLSAFGVAFVFVALVGLGVWSIIKPLPLEDRDPYDAKLEAKAGPETLSLTLILDTSGSMHNTVQGGAKRLDVAKEVLLDTFVPLLDDDAWLALMTFEGRAPILRVRLRPADLRVDPKWTQRERIMEAIDRSTPSGLTPLCGSLAGARETVLANVPGRRAVVLITDGSPTDGSEDAVLDEIRKNDDAGIETYVIGFELGREGRYLEERLGLNKRYFQADQGRDGLLQALQSVLAAIES